MQSFIPLLHKNAAGLTVHEDSIRWVEIALLRDRLTHLRTEEEPIGEDGLEPALQRLAQRVHVDRWAVATSPLHHRVLIVDGPAFEHEEDFNTWLNGEVKKALPAGFDPNLFAASCQVLSLTDDAMRCLLLIARKEAVDGSCSEFKVTALSTPFAGVHRLLTLGGFSGDEIVLMLELETLLFFKKGRIECIEPLSSCWDDFLHELDLQITDRSGLSEKNRVYAAGEDTDGFVAFADDRRNETLSVGALELRFGRKVLPAAFVPAAALALAAITPGSINLLDEVDRSSAVNAVEKAQAMYVLLRTGIVVAALLLIVTAGQLFSDSLLQEALEQRASLTLHLSRVEVAKSELQTLKTDLATAQKLSLTRTTSAQILAEVATHIPDGAWVTSLSFSQENTLEITGQALRREHVTQFLMALERTAFAEQVRLIEAREVNSDKVFQRVRLPRPLQQDQLVVFEIRLKPRAQL